MEQNGVLYLSDCVVEVSRTKIEKEELFKILKHLKPKWTSDDVICTILTGGYANLTLRCYEKTNPEDSVVFRIWTQLKIDIFDELIDRNKEAEMIDKLSKVGVAPKLYAVFQNGVCYEYIDGEKLTTDLCRTDEIAKLIAKNFAKVHGTKLEGSKLENMDLIRLGYKMYPMQHLDPEKNKVLQASIPSREEMEKEVEFIEKYIKDLQCPVVQCHGDPHAQNMMSNKKTGKIILLDYEVTHVGYQPEDIAAYFIMLNIDYTDLNNFLLEGDLPDKSYQCKFLRWYLEEWFAISGKNASEVTEKDVERLFVQVNKYFLYTYFYYAMLFSLFCQVPMENRESFHEDIIELDSNRLAVKFIQKYLKEKKYCQSLEIPK